MLEAQFSHASDFKYILEALNDISSEVIFDCNPNGIFVQAMDPAKVALVSLHVEPLGLLQYKCEPMSFGIYIPALLKLMKCSEHDDILTLKVLGDANEAELQFESKTNGSYLTVLSKLINLDQEKVIIPDLAYPCVVKVPSLKFARMIHDLSQIGDNITIQRNQKDITLESSGGICGSAKLFLRSSSWNNSEDKIEINIDNVFSPVTFKARYLNSFMKAAKLSTAVNLKISDESPLLVEYQISKNLGFIQFYLNYLVS